MRNDHYGDRRLVQDCVADGTEQGAHHLPVAPGADHDHGGILASREQGPRRRLADDLDVDLDIGVVSAVTRQELSGQASLVVDGLRERNRDRGIRHHEQVIARDIPGMDGRDGPSMKAGCLEGEGGGILGRLAAIDPDYDSRGGMAAPISGHQDRAVCVGGNLGRYRAQEESPEAAKPA